MSTVTLTAAALLIVRQAVAASNLDDPAIYFVEATKLMPISKEESDAIRAGADDKVLRAALERDLARSPPAAYRLKAAVYPARNFPADAIVEIHGIKFFLPPELKNREEELTLAVRDSELVLLDGKGKAIYPQ